MAVLPHDLRYALRGLRRQPGFTIAAILCLALGIGANVAIFALVNGALLRPMPMKEPHQLVFAANAPERANGGWGPMSWPDVMDWRTRQDAVEGIAGYRNVTVTLQEGDRPERLTGMGVTEGLFETLGVEPMLGRTFTVDETAPDGPKVVILTSGVWQRRYGSAPDIVGRSIVLQGEPHTVVGVMPEGFRFPWWSDVYLPLQADAARAARGSRNLRAVGRLAEGVTLERARDVLEGVQAGLREAHPEAYAGMGVYLKAYQDEERGSFREGLVVLMVAAGLVLLVACVNVSNLLLARAAARGREMAIRGSLGAGRAALLRQLLAESLLLGVLGSALGLALGLIGRDALLAANPLPQPFWMDFGLDARVTAFVVGVTLCTTLLFGLAPALHALRVGPAALLRTGGDGNASGRGGWGRVLVAGEVALALALLLSAGAMAKGFRSLLDIDPGFDPEGVLTMRVSLARADYPEGAERRVLFDRMMDELSQLPGVDAAGAVQSPPLGGDNWGQYFTVEGTPEPEPGTEPVGNYRVVHGDYFRTAGIAIVSGRGFTAAEIREGSDAVVVNQTLARTYWRGQDPIGRRIRFGSGEDPQPWRTVIGVAADVRHSRLDGGETRPGFYVTYGDAPLTTMTLLLRTGGDPTALAEPARLVVNRLAPTVPVHDVNTFEEYVGYATSQSRFQTFLMSVFSAVAFGLTVLGVAGVTSFVVGRRTREIGIRTALGAAPGRVMRTMLLSGMKPVVIGSAAGLALGYAFLRVVAGSFYGVEAFDPTAYGGILGLLLATALVSVWLPSRSALRVDPNRVLREE